MTSLVATALSALALASPVQDSARYLETRQVAGGCFAEPGGRGDPGLTAWAVLGLRAAGRQPRGLEGALACLERGPEPQTATDLGLRVMALAALGAEQGSDLARLRALARPDGRIGPAVNSTIWGLLALRQSGAAAPPATVRYLLRQQHRSGGWSWTPGGRPDSNDTAAAVQALRAANVRGRPIARGLAYLRRLQNPDGGFELTASRGSDTQSTAWSIQAFLAAGVKPGAKAYAYLARMRRPDGSLRYSARYVTTPVWVTAQALTALAGKPFPLR